MDGSGAAVRRDLKNVEDMFAMYDGKTLKDGRQADCCLYLMARKMVEKQAF